MLSDRPEMCGDFMMGYTEKEIQHILRNIDNNKNMNVWLIFLFLICSTLKHWI